MAALALELYGVFPAEFSARDKLELLELCHANGCSRHREFAALSLDLWKCIERLKQHEISIYNKICKQEGDRVWEDTAASGVEPVEPQESDALYQRQLLREISTLNNHTLSPTLDQYRKKQELIRSLKNTLERATNGTLHTFGSCESGLWVRGSDVDLCLEIPNCNSKRQWLSKLNLIRSALSSNSMVSSISVISAKVPIAKLYNHDNHNFCDISINNTVALDNTRFVKAMTALDFRVVKLARFIKYWATCRCINNRAQGTLSSYTLILQLFHFMQNRDPPILPLYRDIEAQGEGDQSERPTGLFLTDSSEILARCGYLGRNTEPLELLLLEFFRFYSDRRFQGGRRGATIDLYSNEVAENNLGVLVVKCPITGKNVNPFTIRMWQSIYSEFRRADACIRDRRPVSQMCLRTPKPPLELELDTQRRHARMIRQVMLQAQAARSKSVRPFGRT